MKISTTRIYPFPTVLGVFGSFVFIGARLSNGVEITLVYFLFGISPAIVGVILSYIIFRINMSFDETTLYVNHLLKKKHYKFEDIKTIDVCMTNNSNGAAYYLKIESGESEDIYSVAVYNYEELKDFLTHLIKSNPGVKEGRSFRVIMSEKPSYW